VGIAFIIFRIAIRINVLPEWMMKEEPRNRIAEINERYQPWESRVFIGLGIVMVLWYWVW